MNYVRWSLVIAFLVFAGSWVFGPGSLRGAIPFYVVAAGAVGVAYLLPKPTRQTDDEDPTFARWLLDRFAFYGVLLGGVLFGIASGLVFEEPIDLNPAANIGIAIAAAGLCSNFVPRSWFRRTGRSLLPKQ